jgi:hypothetical protein
MAAATHVVNVYTSSGINWETIAAIAGGSLATIVAAVVSAVVVQNTTKQTLVAEEQRLKTRLEFERSETDRPELRAILDPLSTHLERLVWYLGIITGFTAPSVVESNPNGEVSAWLKKQLAPPLKTVADEMKAITPLQDQLRLKLGARGANLERLAKGIKDEAVIIQLAASFRVGVEESQRIAESFNRANAFIREFVEEAQPFTGTRLYSPSEPES